jgi:hypothetical protein
MYYLSQSLAICTYGKSGGRLYWRVIGGAPGVANSDNLEMHWEAVVVGKSVSHHHRHSAWQRSELRRVYGDTGMMEMDWATETYGDQEWRRWME